MEPDDLPEPRDLWWSAVVLVALHRSGAGDALDCRLDRDTMVVALDHDDGSWLRLQHCRGDRHVLWGRSSLAPPAPADARREAPDWALSRATDDRRPTFVAWHAHGEWDASAPADHGALALLRPLLTVDPVLVDRARAGELDEAPAELVSAAAAPPPPLARGRLATRLREQVHSQMREAPEADRMLLQQPPELVRWAQVHTPPPGFRHAVMLRGGELVPAPTNTALPRAGRRTLTEVLRRLHRQEAADTHGAWLFAQVRSDDGLVRFDRAFDRWPSWWRAAHAAQGPSLEDLAREMGGRSTRWRPAWAALLPGAAGVTAAGGRRPTG